MALPVPGSLEPRGYLAVEVEVEVELELEADARGVPLTFATTHFTESDSGARARQAEHLVGLLRGVRTPTILTGDLNARPDSPEVKTLTESLVDAWLDGGTSDGFSYSASRPARRIDYVLASREFDVVRAQVVKSGASDHLPVVADLVLSAAERAD